MKKLFLLRHAKSTREYIELTDFERPLVVKGRKDTADTGFYMMQNKIDPDLILSSPANRAMSTARILAETINYPLSCIQVEESIYEAWVEDLVDLLRKLKTAHNTVILVGHNPSLQILAKQLAEFDKEKFPTCGLLGIDLDIEDWADLSQGCGKIVVELFPGKAS